MNILILITVVGITLILLRPLMDTVKGYKSRETPEKDGTWKSGNPPYKNKKSDFKEEVIE